MRAWAVKKTWREKYPAKREYSFSPGILTFAYKNKNIDCKAIFEAKVSYEEVFAVTPFISFCMESKPKSHLETFLLLYPLYHFAWNGHKQLNR